MNNVYCFRLRNQMNKSAIMLCVSLQEAAEFIEAQLSDFFDDFVVVEYISDERALNYL